jgi:hemoglobin
MIRLVTSFYSEVLQSPRLSPYFTGVAMDSLIAKQASFIDTAIRGDPGYSAADLQRLHAHLKIDDQAFDELLAILDNSLRDHAISGDTSSQIHDAFASFRQAIVNANGQGT